MTQAASVFLPRSEFDEFLFAPIGLDKNGMAISVLSALARLDIDPWQEAAELAHMPDETATNRLTSSLTALLDTLSAEADAGTIAARLIPLLPRRSGPIKPVGKSIYRAASATKSSLMLWFAFTVFLIFGAIFIVAYQ